MKLSRIELAREAGDITRFHTARTVHEETVAQHTFNLVHLLMVLTDGKASRDLILAAMCHDVGEIATGDIPANVKSIMSEDILKELTVMEYAVETTIHPYSFYSLTEEESDLLNLADKLDGLLKCYDELRLGNRHIIKIGERYCDYLMQMTEHKHDEHRVLIAEIIGNFRGLYL